MKKISLLFFVCFILVGFYFFFSDKVRPRDPNAIIIGTSADFPPFSFVKNKEIVGFDIDLAKEVTKRIGKKIEFVNLDFEILLPELQLGNINMIAAGLTITKTRSEKVLFTKPYIGGVPLVVISLKRNTKIEKIEDLKNRMVIVNDGYTADLYMSQIKGIKIRRIPTIIESFLALNSGRGYAYVCAQNIIKPFLKQYGDDKYNLFVINNTDENSAFAISKKNPELKELIQRILDEMTRDGTLEFLKKKWELND